MACGCGCPLASGPVSMVMMHVWFIGHRAHRRICRQIYGETFFFSFIVFLFSRNSRVWFWGLILWNLWIGRAKHPGPAPLPRHVGVEVFNLWGLAYSW